ncbi:hypothetical protein V8D89_008584 [Ganoderma adspersum]
MSGASWLAGVEFVPAIGLTGSGVGHVQVRIETREESNESKLLAAVEPARRGESAGDRRWSALDHSAPLFACVCTSPEPNVEVRTGFRSPCSSDSKLSPALDVYRLLNHFEIELLQLHIRNGVQVVGFLLLAAGGRMSVGRIGVGTLTLLKDKKGRAGKQLFSSLSPPLDSQVDHEAVERAFGERLVEAAHADELHWKELRAPGGVPYDLCALATVPVLAGGRDPKGVSEPSAEGCRLLRGRLTSTSSTRSPFVSDCLPPIIFPCVTSLSSSYSYGYSTSRLAKLWPTWTGPVVNGPFLDYNYNRDPPSNYVGFPDSEPLARLPADAADP